MITGVIGFGGFHTVLLVILRFGAFLHTNTITILDYLVFLSLAIVGNAIGGAVVVGLFKYRIFESNNMK
jgi:formate/nitrite transporter FocA (FNT family)